MSATFPFELLHRFGKIERKSRFTQETIRLPVCQVIDFHTAFRGNQQADIGIDIVITALQYDLYIFTLLHIRNTLFSPIRISRQELGGAFTDFSSGQMIQVDIQIQERALFNKYSSVDRCVTD